MRDGAAAIHLSCAVARSMARAQPQHLRVGVGPGGGLGVCQGPSSAVGLLDGGSPAMAESPDSRSDCGCSGGDLELVGGGGGGGSCGGGGGECIHQAGKQVVTLAGWGWGVCGSGGAHARARCDKVQVGHLGWAELKDIGLMVGCLV